MLIKILLIVAIVIQTIATLFAIRLIRTTKYNSIWILFTIGFTLLSVERVVQFLRANGQTLPYEVFVWLGLVISISMSIGVMYAHKLFKYIARLNRQRQLLNKRILTAVLRTDHFPCASFCSTAICTLEESVAEYSTAASCVPSPSQSPNKKGESKSPWVG